MHITMETDYAIRIVLFLAKEERRVDANTISGHTGVSLRFSLKILRNLVAKGIAVSFKGTQGGYELNRPPEQISLCELLEAVEGEYVFSRCLHGTECTNPQSSSCKVQKVFGDISHLVRDKLDSVTVADLL